MVKPAEVAEATAVTAMDTNSMSNQDVVLRELRRQGKRITGQRKVILDIILQQDWENCKDIYYEAIKANWYTYLVYTVVFFGYFVIFNMVTKGVSLGKRMTGLKIVSTNEKNIGLFRYLFRSLVVYGYFVYPLEILLPLVVPREYLASICSYLSLGVNVLQMAVMVSVLYNQDGRGLHDYLVKTKVVSLNDDVRDGVVLEPKDINNSQEKDIDEVGNKDDDSIEKEKNENKNKD